MVHKHETASACVPSHLRDSSVRVLESHACVLCIASRLYYSIEGLRVSIPNTVTMARYRQMMSVSQASTTEHRVPSMSTHVYVP